jgi:hypothetical protein
MATNAVPPPPQQHADRRNALIHQLYARQVGTCLLRHGCLCAAIGCGEGMSTHNRIDVRCSPSIQCPATQELDECMQLVDAVLQESDGLCHAALVTKALIRRQQGAAAVASHPHTCTCATSAS